MSTAGAQLAWQDLETGTDGGDVFPVLRLRTHGNFDQHTDAVRRELWRAHERGALNDDELARTLDRLEVASSG